MNGTIAAISTPYGPGAIGIIRITGKGAINILNKLFRPKRPIDIPEQPSHTVHYGYFLDGENGGEPIDEVLATIMKGPRTYTKEDTVEISCHGSPFILQKILDNIIKAGARHAEPGEFTKRAFLNGRLDLSQAEAVIDLVNSKTDEASKLAISHLNGNLSIVIKNLQDTIKEMLMELEAGIDFPDEDIPAGDYNAIKENVTNLSIKLKQLISTYMDGMIFKNGITTAIIGRTNVGKSSLFNILVNNPARALVTHIPGTTRDIIDETILLGGKLYRLIDTAGLKTPKGLIEKKSIEATYKSIESAGCVIFLLDGSNDLQNKDLELYNLVKDRSNIVAINKIDLPQKISITAAQKALNKQDIIEISCKKSIGIDKLKSLLLEIANKITNTGDNSDLIITNLRHKNLLEKTLLSIDEAKSAIEKDISTEFVAADLRYALETLQEITGENVSESILDDIFSKFCIGK